MPRRDPEARRAYEAQRRQTPAYKAYQAQYRKTYQPPPETVAKARARSASWYRSNPAGKSAANARYRAKNRDKMRAYLAAWRAARAQVTARPRELLAPEGLTVVRGLDRVRRLSDWRLDAEQDRVLRDLERAARTTTNTEGAPTS